MNRFTGRNDRGTKRENTEKSAEHRQKECRSAGRRHTGDQQEEQQYGIYRWEDHRREEDLPVKIFQGSRQQNARQQAKCQRAKQRRDEDFQRRKKKLLRRRKRRSRWRRLRKGLFWLLLVAVIGAGLVSAYLWLSQLSIFRKKIDISKLDKPQWIEEDYIEPNPYSRPQTELEWVNGVVVHYVGNPGTTARQNQSYFNGLAESHKTYASSHFIIGLDGEIIQCIPLDEIAYCSNDRNQDTISIECCHPDDSGEFTQATYESLVRLTKWLCESFKLDSSEDVIRHYDVTGKECPLYYVRNQEAWERFIQDLR